jgi:general secretion pathway protein J
VSSLCRKTDSGFTIFGKAGFTIFGKAGFTILEMLIAIMVLIMISMGIYQAMWETFKLRDVLSTEGDFYNAIRMSTDILRRDISLIYSPQLMIPPKPSPTPGVPAPPPAPEDLSEMADISQSTKFWGGAIDKSGIRPSRFTGAETSMTFVAATHIRIYKDAPESDFAKIGYELIQDTLEENEELKGQVLKKTEDANAFSDEEDPREKMRSTYSLLRGIKKFRLQYYNKASGNWFNSWDSDREETKNKYPDMIKLNLEVIGPHRLSYEGEYIFRPEVPLRGIDPST